MTNPLTKRAPSVSGITTRMLPNQDQESPQPCSSHHPAAPARGLPPEGCLGSPTPSPQQTETEGWRVQRVRSLITAEAAAAAFEELTGGDGSMPGYRGGAEQASSRPRAASRSRSAQRGGEYVTGLRMATRVRSRASGPSRFSPSSCGDPTPRGMCGFLSSTATIDACSSGP